MEDARIEETTKDLVTSEPSAVPMIGIPMGEDPIKWLETRVEVANRATPVFIKRTIPMDWVRHFARGRGETFYLQATGVDRLASIAGLSFGLPEFHEMKDGPHVAFRCVGDIRCGLFGIELRGVEGARSSKDRFFQNQKDGWDREDVRKSAYNNWRARGASMILGLRGLTADALKAAGFDVDAIPAVEYKSKEGKDSAAPSATENGSAPGAPAASAGETGGGGSSTPGDVISEPQRRRLYAIAASRGKEIGGEDPKTLIRWALDRNGYQGKTDKDLSRGDYKHVVGVIQRIAPEDLR